MEAQKGPLRWGHLPSAGPVALAGPLPGRAQPEPLGTDYKDLLERIPAVTYIAGFGESGVWHYVSPYIETLLGFSPDQWQADPDLWFRQIHPEDRARVIEEERVGRVKGQLSPSEYRIMTRDGRELWVRDEAFLIEDRGGQPCWQGFMIDITDRKQAEGNLHQSEVRYRSLFDNLPLGLYRSTPSGEVMEGNRALVVMLGFATKEALFAADANEFYVDPADRERWKSLLETEGTVRDFETQLRRADGGVLWVRDSARAIRNRDDRVVHYEGVIQDMTRQKQAEWEARQANQQLSGWVGELERRNREMLAINEMGDMLQGCPSPNEAFMVIAHWAEQLFAGKSGAVCAISASRNLVEPVAVWGRPALGEPTFAPDECWALRAGRTHVVENPRSRLMCRHLSEPLSGASLCVPMIAQGEALGILHIQSGPGTLGLAEAGSVGPVDSVKHLAVAVAEHLALALANLKLRESLRTQSIRDPLTGLFNRRYMEESFERELRRAERRGHSVGVVMIDLDHFNHFNNTFGHQAGDALLQAFGDLVRQQVRAEDIACRYGGEEFTLILPEASLEATRATAERVREEVKALRVQMRGQSLGVVTVSCGVAVYPRHGHQAEELIGAADRALYQAKNEGRDQVMAAAEGGS